MSIYNATVLILVAVVTSGWAGGADHSIAADVAGVFYDKAGEDFRDLVADLRYTRSRPVFRRWHWELGVDLRFQWDDYTQDARGQLPYSESHKSPSLVEITLHNLDSLIRNYDSLAQVDVLRYATHHHEYSTYGAVGGQVLLGTPRFWVFDLAGGISLRLCGYKTEWKYTPAAEGYPVPGEEGYVLSVDPGLVARLTLTAGRFVSSFEARYLLWGMLEYDPDDVAHYPDADDFILSVGARLKRWTPRCGIRIRTAVDPSVLIGIGVTYQLGMKGNVGEQVEQQPIAVD